MFVQNDFFDEDDDNKLQMNSSPYTNIQKPTTVQSNSLGRRSIQKEFDVNGDTLYSNSRQDDAGDVNQLQPKENTRKKQTITFKSRGTASIGQSTQKEDSWKPEIPTASRTDSQKARPTFNDDMEFADLDNNQVDKTPYKSNAGWDAPMESNRVDAYASSRDQMMDRPGTGYSNSGVQRGIVQNKQKLLDQNRLHLASVQANDHLSNRNTGGPTYGYTKPEETKDGINYDELQKYAYDGKREFYDPSMKKSDKATFSLSKMSQNIKYERNEDYIPPTRDDIKVKEEAAPLYKEEKYNEPDEDSEREEEPNEDDTQAQKRAEELERKQFEEREAAKKLQAQRNQYEEKVLIAKPQLSNEDSTPTDSSTAREMRILNPEYLDSVDMKAFLTRPAPKGYLIQCNIKREKAGFGMYPKYHVTLSNGFRYLLSGKKEAGSGCSSYIVSMNAKEFSLKSKSYIGRVRSNFIGTEFNVWDTGLKPAKTKNIDALREQLAVVLYERNILGSKGPRKMHVLLPDVKPNGEIYQFKPLAPKEGMLMNYQNKRFEGFKEYYNKPPRWNEQYQAFVLNFNGRVEKPSVKNFQLVHESNEDMIMLQFGRVNKDTFTMDFQWPMSPLQAFGICLTSFDYKLACE